MATTPTTMSTGHEADENDGEKCGDDDDGDDDGDDDHDNDDYDDDNGGGDDDDGTTRVTPLKF